ncbi:hypothetical protein JCM3765_007496 [Sporobolomyces pararoseus]
MLKIREGSFPPSESGQLAFSAPLLLGFWTLTLSISVTLLGTSPKLFRHIDSEAFVASTFIEKFHDVCISFPRSGRCLWANQAALTKVSPYFRSLFSSGFKETKYLTPLSVGNSEGEEATKKEEEIPLQDDSHYLEDSDADNEEPVESPSSTTSPSYITISFTHHSYNTFLSLLCWLSTREIVFASLRSTIEYPCGRRLEGEGQSSSQRINMAMKPFWIDPPRAPPAASPRSIYRLAHYLQLVGPLQDLALNNFKSQLTVENVMKELYSDIASQYWEIRDVAMEFAVKNWKEVVETQAYKDAKARRGIDGPTGLLLSERLMKEWASEGGGQVERAGYRGRAFRGRR